MHGTLVAQRIWETKGVPEVNERGVVVIGCCWSRMLVSLLGSRHCGSESEVVVAVVVPMLLIAPYE